MKNNFLIGLGSILNIKGNYFGFNRSSYEVDLKALKSDWYNVGQDIQNVMDDVMDNLEWKSIKEDKKNLKKDRNNLIKDMNVSLSKYKNTTK